MLDDDIPDYIEVKGKKIPIDKEDYKRWASAAGTRALYFSKAEPTKIIFDGQVVCMLDLREFIQIDPDFQGMAIKLGKLGPKIKNDLIGLGGNYLNPYYLGAKDTKEVIEAWNWLFEQGVERAQTGRGFDCNIY